MAHAGIRWVLIGIIAITAIYKVNNPILGLLIFFLPFTFALLHSRIFFTLRHTLVIFAIIIGVSFVGEYLGVHTGKIFGDYYYNADPKVNGFLVGGVPPLVTLSYVSMGYTCYIMARIVLAAYKKLTGWLLLAVPLLAAMFMVMWDLAFDPTSSVVGHLWLWPRGGAYFGEPFHNFTGWFMVTGTFFVIISVYLYFRAKSKDYIARPSKLFLAEPLALFIANAVSIIIKEAYHNPTIIQQNMALVALFGMGTIIAVVGSRLVTQPHPA